MGIGTTSCGIALGRKPNGCTRFASWSNRLKLLRRSCCSRHEAAEGSRSHPDVGEAVATYWEKVGLKVKRRPVDRAVFQADFRARSYAGVALAYAGAVVSPEPWEPFLLVAHSKASVHLLVEHPQLDELLDRLSAEANSEERVRIMREELGPWLKEYMPAVSIGGTHSIVGVG